MKFLTKQEIFNRVITHLRQQGSAAIDEHGSCAYRGTGGKTCAVGCLIADEHYNPQFEGVGVHRLRGSDITPKAELLKRALVNSGVDANDMNIIVLLESLQNIHDESYHDFSSPEFEQLVEYVAEARSLAIPPQQEE